MKTLVQSHGYSLKNQRMHIWIAMVLPDRALNLAYLNEAGSVS